MRLLLLASLGVVLAACTQAPGVDAGAGPDDAGVDAGPVDAGPCPPPTEFCFRDVTDGTTPVCVSSWADVQALPCSEFPIYGLNEVTLANCGEYTVLEHYPNVGVQAAYFDKRSGALVAVSNPEQEVGSGDCPSYPGSFRPPATCEVGNAPPWCASQLGEAVVGLPCGNIGTCAPDQLCFNEISSHGTSWYCAAATSATCDGLSGWSSGGCPGTPLAECAIDAGVVQCFAPPCDSAPSDYCIEEVFPDAGRNEVCLSKWSDVEALGCDQFTLWNRYLSVSECEGFMELSRQGIDTTDSAFFDVDSGLLLATESKGVDYALSCDPSLRDWDFPNCITLAMPSWCVSDGGDGG